MNFIAFVRLLRPVNLIIIALTMLAMRYWVLDTLIKPLGLSLQMSILHFSLLVLSVVLIAGAGNAINDYFDGKTDRVNKPEKIIVGDKVSRRMAMAIHFVLSISGIILGAYVSWRAGKINLVAIHIFASATLWYYSTVFKKMLLLGNFVVALLAGLVPLVVGIYEVPLLTQAYGAELIERFADSGYEAVAYFKILFYWILGFSLFAFLLNFLREIQKDLSDVKGDALIGRDTLPIVLGFTYTKVILSVFTLIICGSLLLGYHWYINHELSLAYFSLFLIFPLIIANIITWMSESRNHYKLAGNIIKGVMLAGVGYSYFVEKLIV